ncbi:ribosome assembly protein 3, partial [Lecanoromycetidae sp. Uapishka_2]
MEGNFSGLDTLPAYSAQSSQPASSNPQKGHYPPMSSFKTIQLSQVTASEQSCSTEQGDTHAASYSIKVRDSTSFMNKPDLLICRERNNLSTKIGEGRFSKYGPETTIKYLESGIVQNLQLEDHHSQRFEITANGKLCWWWQPSKVDKYRMEIVTPSDRLLAQFTYTGEHAFMGRDVKDGTVLGDLQGKPKNVKAVELPPKSPSPPVESKTSSPEAEKQEIETSDDSPKSESTPAPNESFESYYLRRVTAEFADDIDKIRNASDFTEKSVPVLIQTLKQGAYSFSEEEKERIMGARKE